MSSTDMVSVGSYFSVVLLISISSGMYLQEEVGTKAYQFNN